MLPFYRATVKIQMRQVWQDSCGFKSFSNLIYSSGPATPSLDIIRMWYLDFELEIWKSDNLKIRFQNVWKSNWFTSLTFCGTWTKFNYVNHDFHGNRSNLFSWFLATIMVLLRNMRCSYLRKTLKEISSRDLKMKLFTEKIGQIQKIIEQKLGWIPGFPGFSNSENRTWIWKAQIVELQISCETVPILILFPGNWTSKIPVIAFA